MPELLETENYQDVLDEIAGVFANEFDAPVSDVLTAYVDEDGVVYGNLISAGNFYDYAASDNQLALDFLPEETEEINDYAAGYLAAGYSIKTDSIDSPYDYMYGFNRMDAQVKCTKGGTPCGKICLPKGSVCRKYGSGGSSAAIRNVRGKLRSPVIGGGVIAGKLAAGALAAGAAGYAASRGKNPEAEKQQALQQQRGSISRTARKVGGTAAKVALGGAAGLAGYKATRNARIYSGSESPQAEEQALKQQKGSIGRTARKVGGTAAKVALGGAAGLAGYKATRNLRMYKGADRKKALGAAKERVSLAGGPDAIDVDYKVVNEPRLPAAKRKALPSARNR